jgi:preprotein translocase subunit Sec61beta
MRRRPGRTSSSYTVGNNMLRSYTDEALGLRLSPTMVLVMSVCFFGFVTAHQVFGKLHLQGSNLHPSRRASALHAVNLSAPPSSTLRIRSLLDLSLHRSTAATPRQGN